MGKDGGSGHPLNRQILSQRTAEKDEQVLFHRVLHPVTLVMSVQPVYLVALVPIPEAAVQQRHSLRIHPLIIHGATIIHRKHR